MFFGYAGNQSLAGDIGPLLSRPRLKPILKVWMQVYPIVPSPALEFRDISHAGGTYGAENVSIISSVKDAGPAGDGAPGQAAKLELTIQEIQALF